MTKLIKTTIVISLLIVGAIGYSLIVFSITNEVKSLGLFNCLLISFLYFFSILSFYKLLIRKLEKSVEQRDKEIISKAKRNFFNDITDEESIKEVWKTTIPIRNSIGEEIGQGTVYSRVSDIARGMY